MTRARGWIVAAAAAATLLAAGTVAWSIESHTPDCGEAGVAALVKATDQLRQSMPELEVDPYVQAGDCGFDGTTFRSWSYPGLSRLQSDAAAAGCTVGDIRKYQDEPFVWCPVGDVIVLLSVDDYDGVDVGGSVALQ